MKAQYIIAVSPEDGVIMAMSVELGAPAKALAQAKKIKAP